MFNKKILSCVLGREVVDFIVNEDIVIIECYDKNGNIKQSFHRNKLITMVRICEGADNGK